MFAIILHVSGERCKPRTNGDIVREAFPSVKLLRVIRRKIPTSGQTVDVMCMMDTIRAKRDEIYAVAKKHKAEKLWVFGSCARGEETPENVL